VGDCLLSSQSPNAFPEDPRILVPELIENLAHRSL
jgi:hypothetical protein